VLACGDLAGCAAGMHVREIGFHFWGGEETDVFDAERSEDVRLAVVVEGEACYALDEDAGPVDVCLGDCLVAI
jgi:hypothetical protein